MPIVDRRAVWDLSSSALVGLAHGQGQVINDQRVDAGTRRSWLELASSGLWSATTSFLPMDINGPSNIQDRSGERASFQMRGCSSHRRCCLRSQR